MSRLSYDADGNVVSTEGWKYTYADNGFVVTEKNYADGVLNKETVYKIVTKKDGMSSYPETVTNYNEDGNKTVCVYDENGKTVSETNYNVSGNLID